jgi:hypothetical protein
MLLSLVNLCEAERDMELAEALGMAKERFPWPIRDALNPMIL